MKHKIQFKDDDEVLYLQIIGEYSKEEAENIGQYYHEMYKGKALRQLIVDLREAGKMENRETRKLTKDHIDKADISDVAFIGANAATRMIARVLMKLGNQKAKSTFLKSYDEALNWLKKRRT